jgi:hypothetical protein
MASEFVVSPLTQPQQAERLSQYALDTALPLSPRAAVAIAAALDLNRAQEKKVAARRLAALLTEHGAALNYQRSLEALARMCGGSCWMRVRRKLLPLQSQLRGEIFVMQALRDADERGEWLFQPTLADAGTTILNELRNRWPPDVVPSICTFHIGPQAICVEFEHPTASWMKFNLVGWNALTEKPVDHDLDPADARRFVAKLARALEHTHDGLLVVGAVRGHVVPPWFHFVPVLDVPGRSFRQQVVELGLLPLLDELQPRRPQSAAGSAIAMETQYGPAQLEARWISGADEEQEEALPPRDLQALVDRIARLQRATGLPMAKFIQVLGCGRSDSEGFEMIQADSLERERAAQGIAWADVASAAGLPLNEVLRMLRYGFAWPESLEKVADALRIKDANRLLPPEGDDGEDVVGIRIDEGEPLFHALKGTHAWGRIFSEQLHGELLEQVEAAAENLVEWVDLYQFSHGQFGVGEPIDEQTVIKGLQEQLDELRLMGVALVVRGNIRFTKIPTREGTAKNMVTHQATLFFELEDALRKPAAVRRAA